jgi:hypothetical protein
MTSLMRHYDNCTGLQTYTDVCSGLTSADPSTSLFNITVNSTVTDDVLLVTSSSGHAAVATLILMLSGATWMGLEIVGTTSVVVIITTLLPFVVR